MKRKLSCSLARERDGLAWVSVERLGERRWRLASKGFFPVAGESSREMNGPVPDSSQLCVGILPGSWVASGMARLPKLRHAEMLRALKGWAVREDGARIDDLSLSWRVLEDEKEDWDDQVSVFLAHASREKLNKEMEGFEGHGLHPSVLLPDYLIVDRFLRAAKPETEGLSAWSFVHVGRESTFLCVATKRCLLLHRSLPQDLSQGSDESEYVERLATEVSRSIHRSRQSEATLEVGAIFISGSERLVGLLESELKSMQQASVFTWRAADLIETDGEPLDDEATISAAAAVVGTLDGQDINLLSKQRRGLLSPKVLRRTAIAAAFAGAFLVPLAVVGSFLSLRTSTERMERVRAYREGLQPVLSAAEETDRRWRNAMERERIIAEHAAGSRGLEQVLADLALRTPPQVTLENLKILRRGDDTILQMSGESADDWHADAQKAYLAFVGSLDASEFLARTPQPGYLSISEIEEENGIDGYEEKGVDGEGIIVLRKCVKFSLEYRLVDGEGQGG